MFDASAPCDLDAVYAQALEVVLRRAGLRTLALTPAIEPARLGRALRALDPAAVVLTGQRVSLDAIGRLVYAVRATVREAVVFDFRGAVPDTGASTVFRLGERRSAAEDALLARLERTRRGAGRAAERRPSRRSPPRAVRSRLRRRAAQRARGFLESPAHGSPHRPVDSRASFPQLEETVLERWRERDVFPESVRRRAGAPPWVFYEGPPTANGNPGTHHVLAACSRTSSPATGRCAATTSSARAAGTATACRSSWPSRRSSASRPRPTSSATASPSSTRDAARRCSATSTSGTA